VLATSFSFAGAKVALVARTEDDLRSAAADLPGETLICAGDVTDEEFNESAANAVVEAWGGLDVWISNAGISPIVEGPRETTAQIWREIVDVNLTGTFLGARSASRVMTSGGRIIFTGSVLGDRPRRGLSAYSATKAAVVALAKGLALDLAGQGITVNVVAPGWFDSPLVVPWMRDEERSAELLDHITFGRLGRPAELPGAYLYLASDAASYVTGTVLNLDGGYSLQ
jgi:NAD(P)-dependent dehydrogenase (short-subunit alcohol dehydrogenase family)